MKRPHILLVEDEQHIAKGLIFNLEAEGFHVAHVESCAEAYDALAHEMPDLLILDLMLPDGHGMEICREVRKKNLQLPILILTALGDEEDRVSGLREGADDYLSKPFSLDEFLLRVEGMLRRSQWYRFNKGDKDQYQFGDNRVDLNNLEAQTKHGNIKLTELESRMLGIFFDNEGETLTRTELLKSVWGLAEDTETRTLDNFIVRMRRYFEKDPTVPQHFLTVRGRGYRFVKQTPDKPDTSKPKQTNQDNGGSIV